MNRLKRIISLCLSIVFVLGVLPLNVFADKNGISSNAVIGGAGGGLGGVDYVYSGNGITGYKIELLFLPISEDILNEKDKTTRRNSIIKEWDNADLSGTNPDEGVQYIGTPVYLTSKGIVDTAGTKISYGYSSTDFQYGLGTSEGNPRKTRNTAFIGENLKKVSTITTDDIFQKICRGMGKYSMSSDLPITLAFDSSQLNNKYTFESYFLYKKPHTNESASDSITADYYATNELAALINYISTSGGTDVNDATEIYFKETAQKQSNGSTIINPHNVDSSKPNIFDEDKYNGTVGEYRLLVSPFVGIHSSKASDGFGSKENEVAVTLRDMYSIGSDCYKDSQAKAFRGMAKALCFDKDDFFTMHGKSSSDIEKSFTTTTKVVSELTEFNTGCGIGLISSEMVREGKLGKTNIGSITHIFLDGDKVKTASMEYVGKKNEQAENTNKAILQATLQLAKASTDKNGVSTNAFVNVYK